VLRKSSALITLLCLSEVTWANAGVPMIFLVMPAFAISLVPIIVIEAIYIGKRLGIPLTKSSKTALVSNLVSTAVGIPLTWLLLTAVQLLFGGDGAFGIDTLRGKILSVTLQAPWLIPYESDLHWMIPVAGIFLLIPFFFVSWFCEYRVSVQMLSNHNPPRVKSVVRNANVITYVLLVLWPLGFMMSNTSSG